MAFLGSQSRHVGHRHASSWLILAVPIRTSRDPARQLLVLAWAWRWTGGISTYSKLANASPPLGAHQPSIEPHTGVIDPVFTSDFP